MTTPTTSPDAADRAAERICHGGLTPITGSVLSVAAIIREEHAKDVEVTTNIIRTLTYDRDSLTELLETSRKLAEQEFERCLGWIRKSVSLEADVAELIEALRSTFSALARASLILPPHDGNKDRAAWDADVALAKARAVLAWHTAQTTEATKGTP